MKGQKLAKRLRQPHLRFFGGHQVTTRKRSKENRKYRVKTDDDVEKMIDECDNRKIVP